MTWKLLPDKKMKLLTQANVLSQETCKSIIKNCGGDPSMRRHTSNRFNFEAIDMDPVEWIKVYEPITGAILDANVNNYGFKLHGISGLYYIEIGDRGFLDWTMDMMEPSRETNKLTIYIPLNDDYEGGNFSVMDPHPRQIPTEVGQLLLFPSFVLSKQDPTSKGIKRMIAGTVTGLPFS